jgi:serine/threonine protein kinase/DNA-binding beta-propeller fold protein YncE
MEGLRQGDPEQLGPYRLLGRLGRGGMGQVFLGRSPGGHLLAIKAIHAELAGDREFRWRFSREVAAARRVDGLFTAQLVDADTEGPVVWLATAYVAGASLADAVAAHGPLPEASVVALAAGLAEGLTAIHKAGLVHRDLKPQNVLLAHDGPRVIDFGISRAAEESSLTQTGTLVGSPGFMSPEQAEGGLVGPETDVFSLGAVLAFAATGEGPFGTGSAPALLYRVVHGSPRTDNLPGQIRELVRPCLAKDPSQRPTAARLLKDLGTVLPASDWLPPGLRSSSDPPVTTEGKDDYAHPAAARDQATHQASTITPVPPDAARVPVVSPGEPRHSQYDLPRRQTTWSARRRARREQRKTLAEAEAWKDSSSARLEEEQRIESARRKMERVGRKIEPSPVRIRAMAYIVSYDDGTLTPVHRGPLKAGTPIKVGPTPSAIAIRPDGAVGYVTNRGLGAVTPVDLVTATRGNPIVVGSAPVGIAITPDGTTAYVACDASEGQAPIGDMPGCTVTPINLGTGAPGVPIRAGTIKPTAIAITPDGSTAYVVGADNDLGTAIPIELGTGTPGSPIPVGPSPTAIAIASDGITAYVVNGNCMVIPIDLSANHANPPIDVGLGRAADLASIALSPNGAAAYVVGGKMPDRLKIVPINLATNRCRQELRFSGRYGAPTAVTVDTDNSHAFVTCSSPNGGMVGLVDLTGLHPGGNWIEVGRNPCSIGMRYQPQ